MTLAQHEHVEDYEVLLATITKAKIVAESHWLSMGFRIESLPFVGLHTFGIFQKNDAASQIARLTVLLCWVNYSDIT